MLRRLALGDPRTARWTTAAALAALMLASLLLRTRQLNFHLWIDEAISVGISSHPLGRLPQLLREDGSPPLYYLLLHFWMLVFGRGEVATHCLSLVFALLAIPVAYAGGEGLGDRRAGLYAASIAAGVPFLTSYAQETRMYSMLALLSLLTAMSFVHVFVLRRRRYLPLFCLSLIASLYTHDWALFLAAASLVAFLGCLWASPSRRALLRDGALAYGLVAVAYLPWLPTLLYQARHTGAPWALPPVVWSLTQGLYFIVGGRGAAVALLLAGGCGLVALRADGPDAQPARRTAIVLAVLGFGTLLIAWAYAKTTPAWSFRYLAVVVGPLTLLAALGLARARGLGVAALALVCCFWAIDPRPSARYAKSNVALVAQAVRPQTGASTLVLSTQPEQVPALAYYLPGAGRFATPLGLVPDPRVMDWRNALARFEHSSVASVLAPMIRSLRPGQRVLLVVPVAYAKSPEWMRLIHRASTTWTRYLRHDPALSLLRVASPHVYATNLGVRGTLYAVRPRATSRRGPAATAPRPGSGHRAR